jgi:DMSO/TMAO reductase YedYZ heme-binding membrane subunit
MGHVDMMKSSFLFLLLAVGVAFIAGLTALTHAPVAGTLFIRFLGLSSFFLVCASLLIGPAITLFPSWGPLAEPRRAVGISAFAFILVHLLLASSMYFNFNLAMMSTQVPIDIGAAAAVIFLALTVTSSDYAVKTLGADNWKLVQRLNYIAFIISFAHFILEIKGLKGGTIYPAETLMLALGVLVVALQVAGFMKRKADAKPTPVNAGEKNR